MKQSCALLLPLFFPGMLEIIKMPHEPEPGINMKLCHRAFIVKGGRDMKGPGHHNTFPWVGYITYCSMNDPYTKTHEYIYSKPSIGYYGSHLQCKSRYGTF